MIARTERDLELICEGLQLMADKRGQLQKVEAVIDLVQAELGPVDVLINNAGTSVQVRDADAYAKSSKTRWAGHVMHPNMNRWTRAVSERTPWNVKARRGGHRPDCQTSS
ncbi:hypothetical protein ANCDUO_02730 [Ancylostoma duodenale]|uniref:Uncharacterized protein n=1 Tax=Ancylostoma duodenale TaxID=51022 RepID=A0A0C2HBS0_9BILA|nr:hypothetical protein ANCDUO_02730 [Ancylostoma duodenale]